MAAQALERYVLGPSIAAGGMGTVHIGRIRGAEGFSRIVAIKCLRAEFAGDSDHVTMFIDEAQMAARIRHANVVPTLDVCRSGGELWIVMEYVAGESLARLMRAGPVEPGVALAIFHDMLAGLEGAHTATDARGAPLGLVHRDVSPQNVLVGVDGVARIVDFGIAKARNRASVTREGEYKGKFGYTAPEVVQGKPSTERSDVYSAAVTLWEALVGRRLFVGENESTVLYNVLEWVPPLVSVAAPGIGASFDAVIARSLDKDPEKRFGSAREMLDALDTCGKRAGAREVARALASTAAESLAARAELVRAFEGGRTSDLPPDGPHLNEAAMATVTSVTPFAQTALAQVANETPSSGTVRLLAAPPPPSAPAAPVPPRSTLSVPLAIAAGVVVLAVAGLAVRMATHRSAAASPAALLSSSQASPSAPDTPDESPPAPVVESAPLLTPAAPAPHASAEAGAPRGKRAHGPGLHRVPVAGKGCEPPFTVDALGDKHYKPECFR